MPEPNAVLVIDDEDNVRRVIGRMVESLGYRAIPAADGSQAIHEYAAHAEEIVAATLDLTMPTTNGRETLAILSHVAPFLPIVVSSALPPGSEQLQGRIPGTPGVVYLQKPYSAEALGKALERVIGELPKP